MVPIYQSTLHYTPPQHWSPFTNQLYITPLQNIGPHLPINFTSFPHLSKLLANQTSYYCGLLTSCTSRTQQCISYLDIQSRDVKYCQVNQLGNCAMYVAQSCCGRSSVWLFFAATIHVRTWRRKIKHSSRTTTFLPHTASPGPKNTNMLLVMEGTAVAQWLRCCTTNWKVAGSIPAGVIGIFHWHKILLIALWPWGRLSL